MIYSGGFHCSHYVYFIYLCFQLCSWILSLVINIIAVVIIIIIKTIINIPFSLSSLHSSSLLGRDKERINACISLEEDVKQGRANSRGRWRKAREAETAWKLRGVRWGPCVRRRQSGTGQQQRKRLEGNVLIWERWLPPSITVLFSCSRGRNKVSDYAVRGKGLRVPECELIRFWRHAGGFRDAPYTVLIDPSACWFSVSD